MVVVVMMMVVEGSIVIIMIVIMDCYILKDGMFWIRPIVIRRVVVLLSKQNGRGTGQDPVVVCGGGGGCE